MDSGVQGTCGLWELCTRWEFGVEGKCPPWGFRHKAYNARDQVNAMAILHAPGMQKLLLEKCRLKPNNP